MLRALRFRTVSGGTERTLVLAGVLWLAAVSLTACGADSKPPVAGTPAAEHAVAAEPPSGDHLRVEDAWIFATPGSGTAAVYLVILNPTVDEDLLVGVETAAAKVAEVHETLGEDGTMRMRAFPEGMPVPARSRVQLAPGGKHIMLLALEEALDPGREVELDLHFERAGTFHVVAPVRLPGTEGAG